VAGRYCDQCGVLRAAPADGTGDLRGVVFEHRRWGSRRSLLATEVAGELVVSVDPGGERRDVARHRVAAPANSTPAAVRSWRLLNAVSFPQPEVQRLLTAVLSEVAQGRALARFGITAGDQAAIDASGLSELERRWCSAHLCWRSGDRMSAAAQFAELPSGRYPDAQPVLVALWDELMVDGSLCALALLRAESFADDPWSQLLLAMAGESAPVASWSIGDLVDRARQMIPTGPVAESTVPAVCELGFRASQGDGRASAASGGALALRAALRDTSLSPADLGPTTLADAPLPILDELVDAGGAWLDPGWLTHRHRDRPYLLARTDPRLLSDADLDTGSFESERARRAFLDGELSESDAIADPEMAGLTALRRGDRTAVGSLAALYGELGDEHRRTRVLALGRSLHDGVIDSALAFDRSCWPLLAPLLPPESEWRSMASALQPIAAWSVLYRALELLWRGHWQDAASAAKDALRASPVERVRDEALNLLAYAQWMQGNDEAALAALEEAVAGERTPNLQVNYALVAGGSIDDDDKWGASLQLASLADESANLGQSVSAIERAVALWGEIPAGSDVGDYPPIELIEVARRIVVEPTTEEGHDRIMAFLAWADAEWLEVAGNTKASKWSDGARHRFRVARAQGPSEVVTVLKSLVDSSTTSLDDREWVIEQGAQLASALVSAMLESEEPPIGMALWAFELADAKLPFPAVTRVRLELVAVRMAAAAVAADDDGYPGEVLWDRLEAAIDLYDKTPDMADELPRALIEVTVDHYAWMCLPGWAREHDQIAEAHNSIVGQLSGMYRWQIDRSAVLRATSPLLEVIRSSDGYMHAVRTRVTDPEVRGHIDDIRAGLREMYQRLEKLP